MNRRLPLAILPALVVVLGACGDEAAGPSSATTPRLEALQGNAQTGVVGRALDQPLRVAVVGALGFGVPGAELTFDVAAGGGKLMDAEGAAAEQLSVATDARGFAEVGWILGPFVGRQGVSVVLDRAGGDRVAVGFSATALPGPPVETTVNSEQGSLVIVDVSTLLSIQVHDEFGNPIVDTLVTWQATGVSGSFRATSSVTDLGGRSSMEFTPTGLGAFEIEALVDGKAVAVGDFIAVQALAGDPSGDIFGVPEGRIGPDVRGLGAWIDAADDLHVYLEFWSDVALYGSDEPNEMLGALDLDLDQDSETGNFPVTGHFNSMIEMGDELLVPFVPGSTGQFDVLRYLGPTELDFEVVGSVTPDLAGKLLGLVIPAAMLGGPDRDLDLAALLGTPDGPGSNLRLSYDLILDGETIAVIDLVPNGPSLTLSAAAPETASR